MKRRTIRHSPGFRRTRRAASPGLRASRAGGPRRSRSGCRSRSSSSAPPRLRRRELVQAAALEEVQVQHTQRTQRFRSPLRRAGRQTSAARTRKRPSPRHSRPAGTAEVSSRGSLDRGGTVAAIRSTRALRARTIWQRSSLDGEPPCRVSAGGLAAAAALSAGCGEPAVTSEAREAAAGGLTAGAQPAHSSRGKPAAKRRPASM